MKYSFTKNKRKNGFTSLEALTSALFIVVATIFSLDCWFMITAVRVTDAACKDATHAAALTLDTGNASVDTYNATSAAQTAVQAYARYANYWMTPPQVSVTYNSTATPPNVVVVTSMYVTPLIPCNFLGNSMNGVNFSQQYSFPIIKSMAGVTIGNNP